MPSWTGLRTEAFYLEQRTGMMRIPAGGGEPVKVPGDAAPRMLPGGKAALFVSRSGAGRGNADTVAIEAVSLRGWQT